MCAGERVAYAEKTRLWTVGVASDEALARDEGHRVTVPFAVIHIGELGCGVLDEWGLVRRITASRLDVVGKPYAGPHARDEQKGERRGSDFGKGPGVSSSLLRHDCSSPRTFARGPAHT